MDALFIRWVRDITMYGLEKIGLYYSQYRGFVADNRDPKNLHRLRINVPDIHGDAVPNLWAWPASNYSGKGYGMQCIPQINDVIWVSFEHGNPRKPLWSYSYFAKDHVPEDLIGNHKYWFRTPTGLTILFDNNTKEVHIYEKDKEIQPMVLGDTLEELLMDLFDIIKAMKINTQLGPQSILPLYTQQLDELANRLEEFKSLNGKLS